MKTIKALKEFGVTDDQILKIATQRWLKDSISLLKEALYKKWNIDTLTAMETVKKIKSELDE